MINRKMRLFCYAMMISVFAIPIVNAQQHCDAVLQYASTNITSKLTLEERKAYAYQKACNSQYSNSSGGIKVGIEAVIKSVPIGINFGSNDSEEQVQTWCNQNTKYEDSKDFSVLYEQTVFEPAVRAWSNCVGANQQNLKVETKRDNNDRVIAFRITNETADNDVNLRGVFVDAQDNGKISCKLVRDRRTVTAKESTREKLLPRQGVNVICNREEVAVSRNNQSLKILPSGSITLNTKLFNYQYSFEERSNIRLTDLRADRIEQQLKEVSERMGMQGTDCLRVDRIQICWGVAALSPNSSANWTAPFNFQFSKPFASPPKVTNGINTLSSGHGMFVYNWNVSNTAYSGSLNNEFVGSAITGTVTMNYIAIGEAVE